MSWSIGMTGVASTATVRATARRPGPGGFRVPEETEGAVAAALVGSVSLPSLLALQEAGQDAVRDREAQQHGEAMLDVLAGLQRALLGGADADTLGRLATLVRRMPAAADPRLAAVQRAVLVRAAVELARAKLG